MQDATTVASPTLAKEHIELARAAVCSLSTQPDGALSAAVNIHRIRHLLRGLMDSSTILAALQRMELLTEVVSLPNSYWLPVPIRFVDILGTYIVIGALPLEMLVRTTTREISLVGSGRISAGRPLATPEQDYWSWTGAPKDTLEWANKQLKDARDRLAETSIDALQVDVHSVPQPQAKSVGRWKALTRLPDFTGQALCRCKLGATSYRYLFAQIKKGELTHEAEIKREHRARLRYALDSFEGCAHAYIARLSAGHYHFQLYRPLPIEESRALHALAWCETDGSTLIVRFVPEMLRPIREVLSPLGIRLETIE